MTTSIPETIGSFRIQGKIGQGGMGAVYRAVHGTLERPVALKVLPGEFANNPEYVTRFLREARTIATLRHENVVQVYDAGEINGQYFIAMELVEGSNLGNYADAHRPFDEKEGLELLMQAARGLDAAHGKGLVHRDIKPENLLLSGDKTLRIVDFGLVMESTSTTQLTATGACLGTPMYMSPEQADGENADSRTDIYSLGVTFYRVFTGQTPFTSATVMNLLFKHKFEAPPDPRSVRPDLSPNVSNLLLHMLAKRREERPQSAQKLIEMMDSIRQGKVIPPPPTFAPIPSATASSLALEQTMITGPSQTKSASNQPRTVPFLGIAVICLVLAVLITTVYLLGRNPAGSTGQTGLGGAGDPAPGDVVHLEKPADPQPVPAMSTGSAVDDALARGDKAFVSGTLKSAIDEYRIGLVADPQNAELRARIKKTENTILYKSAMESGGALEASGRWEEALKQYTAAKPYGDGAQRRIDAVNIKLAEQKNLESTSNSSALDVATRRAEEAEKNLMFDRAAEHYSRAATLATPPLRSVLADKAQECRRQDYIAQGKAAEALQDYADAELKYKKALAIRDDPLVADKVEAMAMKVAPAATMTAPDKASQDRERSEAMAAARVAITSGNLSLARQKIELAKRASPNHPDTIALSAEVDARDLMAQAAVAAVADKTRAISLYRQALTVCPSLSGEIAPRLNAVLGSASSAPVNTEKIDALVRDFKDDDASTEVANALRGNPNSAALQQARDGLESMRYGYWIFHQLGVCIDKSRRMASDAIDLDDDERNKAVRGKLKKYYEDLNVKEQQIRQMFLSHDYSGVQTMLAAARTDTVEYSAKLVNEANFYETRADKSEKGLKIGFVGINTDTKKASKYRVIVDEIRRNAEEAKNLKKYGDR